MLSGMKLSKAGSWSLMLSNSLYMLMTVTSKAARPCIVLKSKRRPRPHTYTASKHMQSRLLQSSNKYWLRISSMAGPLQEHKYNILKYCILLLYFLISKST